MKLYNKLLRKQTEKETDTSKNESFAHQISALESSTSALSSKLSAFLFDPNPQQADSAGLDELVKTTDSLAEKIDRLQEDPV